MLPRPSVSTLAAFLFAIPDVDIAAAQAMHVAGIRWVHDGSYSPDAHGSRTLSDGAECREYEGAAEQCAAARPTDAAAQRAAR